MSLQRGDDVRVARGDVVAVEGDVITVFSGPQGRERLEERLSPVETPTSQEGEQVDSHDQPAD